MISGEASVAIIIAFLVISIWRVTCKDGYTYYTDIIAPPKNKSKLLKRQRELFWDNNISVKFIESLKELENSQYEQEFNTTILTDAKHFTLDKEIVSKMRGKFLRKGWDFVYDVRPDTTVEWFITIKGN